MRSYDPKTIPRRAVAREIKAYTLADLALVIVGRHG